MNTVVPILLLLGGLLASPTLVAQDYDALIRQAVEARNAGELDTAERLLRQAWDIPPDKREVAYLLGMVVAFQDRHAEALTILDSALLQYPDDLQLQLGRARVLYFQGEFEAARRSVNEVLERSPDNAEALELAGQLAASLQDPLSSQSPQTLAVGFSRSTFDLPGLAEWNDRFIEYRRQRTNGNQQYLRLEHNHRFGTHDTMAEAGVAFRQRARVPMELAVAFTPNDDFMPEYLLRYQARTTLHEGARGFGTVALAGLYQYASWANGATNRIQIGLEYYLPNTDAWLTPMLGMVRDQDGIDTFAWGLGAHWQVGARTRLGISYSEAPETENLITTDSRNSQVYLRRDLGTHWQLSLNYSRFARTASYTREMTDLVLQYRF